MRQIHWSPKPTNRETNKSTIIKPYSPYNFKTNLYKFKTNPYKFKSNPYKLKTKLNTISLQPQQGQKEHQKLRTTNHPTEGVTLIKVHFIENIPVLGSMHHSE